MSSWDNIRHAAAEANRERTEAWEHIAPELPQETCISGNEVVGYWIEWWGPDEERPGFGMILTSMKFKTEAAATEALWALFGGRKRYAELIAVERVREVAESSGWALIAVHMEAPRLAFIVDNGQMTVSHGGPTPCDAAWACIQALGGGE